MRERTKRLLIAGGGYADIPLIRSARKLGYYVISSGNRPEELGHRYSDEYRQADFSDLGAMLDLAREIKPDAVCACCNDFSALSAAYVAEQLGLPGHDPYEISKTLHHKDLYRQFALEHDIPTPRAKGFCSVAQALEEINGLTYPLIIKPVDLTGGKGISKISRVDEARAALEKAFSISRAKRVVVEEFITGTRHGFSAFLRDEEVVFHFSDNEHYYLNPYMVSAASTPSIAPPEITEKLCAESRKIASLLSLKTGILHIQYILRGNEPIIIEICRRAPGDLYIKFVEHATGVDYPSWIVRASAGLDCRGLTHVQPRGFFTRHCVMAHSAGRVTDIVFDSTIRHNVIDKFMWWKPGDEVVDVMTTKFGIVFLRFDSMHEMLDKTDRMHELIRVEMA